ncbi:type 1 periplasmic-binding domain-containing protein [Blattabacterium cuenoti]|uniref:hypothetical protein n=1 Tax=Blattabacterium cuenoti TaxID=1653831 RepID=UPI001EEB8A90|nr:hypothetical protein [Blattabacterium cuenoti]
MKMIKIFFITFSFIIFSFSKGKGIKNKECNIFNKKIHLITKNKEEETPPINIIFMLPLFFGSDEIEEEIHHDNKKLSENALSFYFGAKAAIDLFNKKQKVNIQIFDTKNEKIRIKNFMRSYDLSNTHAIIGPFFRSSLEEVAKNNKNIPIISPFTDSDSLNFYPNVIQSETKDIYLVEPILEKIKIIHNNQKEKIKTLYIFGEDPSKKITNFIKKKFLQWNLNFQILHFVKNFSNTIKNISFFAIFLGGNTFIEKEFIDLLKKKKKIIPFGIGYHDIFYKNISLFKEYQFLFTTKYFFNKNDEKKIKFFYFFKKKLGNNLNKYPFYGFDLTYDILYRLFENKNLFQTIDQKSFSGLVSKYKYHKIFDKGGYVNKGFWIIRL